MRVCMVTRDKKSVMFMLTKNPSGVSKHCTSQQELIRTDGYSPNEHAQKFIKMKQCHFNNSFFVT